MPPQPGSTLPFAQSSVFPFPLCPMPWKYNDSFALRAAPASCSSPSLSLTCCGDMRFHKKPTCPCMMALTLSPPPLIRRNYCIFVITWWWFAQNLPLNKVYSFAFSRHVLPIVLSQTFLIQNQKDMNIIVMTTRFLVSLLKVGK